MAEFNKQPNESYTIAIDYSEAGSKPTGTALASGTVASTKLSDGTTDNSVIGSTTATIDVVNDQAKVVVQAGTSGEGYRITFSVTLDNGAILEDEVTMFVVDA